MITNKVKLVIWDLDETFWRGTLAEEGITPIDGNVEKIIELSKRGIINSICSKNNFESARAKLAELGVWDYFVFPVISFNPKGKAVAEMIEAAALRSENVLFIDDNPSNLEEVRFFNPGIMTGHPGEVLQDLLDHPHCLGKPDPELTRLNQYRFLQKKFEDRSASTLSNEEFLRASNIRVTIDYDVESNFDRIVELINRTNQLNYTKRRLEKPEAVEEFRSLLNESFGYHAGCVRAVDNYGDYGLVGFFLMERGPNKKELIHFVFSCRTMNMGIEQYIYEMLGRPDIEITGPVAYAIESNAKIDWINAGPASTGGMLGVSTAKLVLLGGCDLLQLASYCSSNRLEFINRVQDDIKVCYEDPGFIMGDRSLIGNSKTLRNIICWSYEDVLRFDEGIAEADIFLLSMWPSMNGEVLRTDDGVELRITRSKVVERIRARNPEWFDRHLSTVRVSDQDRLARLVESFEAVRERANPSCHVFVLGIYSTGDAKPRQNTRRSAFNKVCQEYCERHPGRFHFVDYNTIVPPECLVDGMHFNRQGYFTLARYILDRAEVREPERRQALSDRQAGLVIA